MGVRVAVALVRRQLFSRQIELVTDARSVTFGSSGTVAMASEQTPVELDNSAISVIAPVSQAPQSSLVRALAVLTN